MSGWVHRFLESPPPLRGRAREGGTPSLDSLTCGFTPSQPSPLKGEGLEGAGQAHV
jgi:hypothetical protein